MENFQPIAKAYMIANGFTKIEEFRGFEYIIWVRGQMKLYLKERKIDRISNIEDWKNYFVEKYLNGNHT